MTPTNSATLFAFNGDKIKLGRNAGPLRPQETTWDQSNFGPSPTGYKAEDTQIVSSNFYVTGMYSVVNGGFELVPEGGAALAYRDPNLVWHNSFFLNQIERPQKQGKLDASNFFNIGGVSNELKYGAAYRTAEQSSLLSCQAGGAELALSPRHPPAAPHPRRPPQDRDRLQQRLSPGHRFRSATSRPTSACATTARAARTSPPRPVPTRSSRSSSPPSTTRARTPASPGTPSRRASA